jgi:hypothetical protein
VSHRPHMVGGVKHKPRCACPACDPDGLLVKRARDEHLAAERARRAGQAPPVPRTLARPFPQVVRPRLPSRGPDRRMKRFHELRQAGASIADAHAQIEREEREGLL